MQTRTPFAFLCLPSALLPLCMYLCACIYVCVWMHVYVQVRVCVYMCVMLPEQVMNLSGFVCPVSENILNIPGTYGKSATNSSTEQSLNCLNYERRPTGAGSLLQPKSSEQSFSQREEARLPNREMMPGLRISKLAEAALKVPYRRQDTFQGSLDPTSRLWCVCRQILLFLESSEQQAEHVLHRSLELSLP